MFVLIALGVNATDYNVQEPLKLDVPEMEPKLVYGETQDYHPELSLATLPSTSPATDKWTWMHTNEGVKPYKFMDDMTWVGVPMFVAGIIAKSEKTAFAQQRKHSLLTEFKTSIDDYSQYFGPAMTVGLKLAGVEGRSDWGRLLASAGLGYAAMAILVNGIKYTAKEMRPDGSQANSWPSGHTATSFVGATVLHKEYGLTRSPWYSVAGYSVATATGVMRVLNNRHWVSDVLSGAGIGILSGELGYAIGDLLFKGRGLLRNDLPGAPSVIDHPSFFAVSMGIGFGTRDLDFDMSNMGWAENLNLKFQASTAVSAEGAYFFNPYIGVGGRLRVKSSPIKGWNNITDYAWSDVIYYFVDEDGSVHPDLVDAIDDIDFIIESDHLTEFAVDLGAYFNIPLSNRFALGAKLLIGRSIMQELALDGKLSGHSFRLNDDYDLYVDMNSPFDTRWDYFTVSGNNTMKYGTGISLTYAYKQNFSWRVFLDYDFSRKTYTMIYDANGFFTGLLPDIDFSMAKISKSIKKNMNSWVLGASFAVNF